MALDDYAQHDKSITVPNLLGFDSESLDQVIAGSDLTIVIEDSVYLPNEVPGIVLRQDPDPMQSVKPGRNVYLQINFYQPPTMAVPSVVDMTERLATQKLEAIGLAQLTPIMVSDTFPVVLQMLYEGETLTAGQRIPANAKVQLVIGAGKRSTAQPQRICIDQNMSFDFANEQR
jgi:beta-lactam-binding protein with PASTA domain